MKSIKSVLAKSLTALVVVGGCALASLWGVKYFATQNETIYYTMNTPKPGIYIATGNVGEYPVILKSNQGREWQELYPKGRLSSLFPSQSEYGRFSANSAGTIWLTEGENCSECRHESLGIYYSHDTGDSWVSIPEKYIQAHTWLVFYSARYGELAVPQPENEESSDYYHTLDGGKNWIPGSLKDIYKATEPAGFRGGCSSYYLNSTDPPAPGFKEYSDGKDTVMIREVPSYGRVK